MSAANAAGMRRTLMSLLPALACSPALFVLALALINLVNLAKGR
jgi:hypothetical protein